VKINQEQLEDILRVLAKHKRFNPDYGKRHSQEPESEMKQSEQTTQDTVLESTNGQ
jgi:hypothetical protein